MSENTDKQVFKAAVNSQFWRLQVEAIEDYVVRTKKTLCALDVTDSQFPSEYAKLQGCLEAMDWLLLYVKTRAGT